MHLFGDNGIITNAKNASILQNCAIISEYLNERYVAYAAEDNNIIAENNINKIEYLNSKMTDLLLKDGVRNYIINGGKVYYLLNKSALPEEIRSSVRGGDSTEPDSYTRLIDVFGVTKNLDVYYINSDSNQMYGNVEYYDIDPDLVSYASVANSSVADQLANALKTQKGITVGSDDIKLRQIVTLDTFTLNGQEIEGLSDLSALADCISMEKLTLENLDLTSLSGIDKMTKLSSLYFRNVTCENYSALCSLWNLTKLYIYMPSDTMDEATCNNEVINLGNGLANASKLNKLEYFGISRR